MCIRDSYKGVTVITPNHLEATQAAGVQGEDDKAITKAGTILRQRLGCQTVLVTRGERGMSVYQAHGDHWHIPTRARQVYDVTGAGDTVVGTLALALSTGASTVSYTHLDVYKRQGYVIYFRSEAPTASAVLEEFAHLLQARRRRFISLQAQEMALRREIEVHECLERQACPVSYTHLDVYKRQVQERIEPIILRENRFARMFLSITRKQDRYLRVFSQQASKSLEYFESCLERAL